MQIGPGEITQCFAACGWLQGWRWTYVFPITYIFTSICFIPSVINQVSLSVLVIYLQYGGGPLQEKDEH